MRKSRLLKFLKLVIFDDMMEETCNNLNIQHLFTRGSHHHNMSIFLLTQNLFAKGKFARTINLNAHYTIIFDNQRDRTQIRYLAREIFPENSKFLIEAYTDAIKSPHGYIFIDNKQGTPPEVRIQTNISEPIRTVYKLKTIWIFIEINYSKNYQALFCQHQNLNHDI